jgi:exodeoxyribonuclease V alpha subunit
MRTVPTLVPGGSAQALARRDSSYPADLVALMQASDLDECRAYLAWQLSEMAVELSAPERTAFLLLCARLLVAEGQGSTRLALGDADRALLARVPELASESAGNTPLVVAHDHLYTRRSHACEARVVAALAARLGQASPFSTSAIEQALRDGAASASPPPSAAQAAAVVHALARLVGIISGGPGTGKTTTALTLVRCLVRLGVSASRIALCAPTGKAASRMEDDFRRRLGAVEKPDAADLALLHDCPKAQTLHRLLGVGADPRSLFRRSDEPLPFQAVIVDESSMVDLVLMDRLLGAVPAAVPLILLGDADQLPSVAAGAVFRDLGAYATRLRHGFRTGNSGAAGQQLSALALAVRAGDVAAVSAVGTTYVEAKQLRHAGVEQVPREKRTELLRQYHRRHFANDEVVALTRHVYSLHQGDREAGDEAGFNREDVARLDALASRFARARILTVTREGAAGSIHANAFLHSLHGDGPGFLPGEPVLMLRNDYQRELWNGDQGVAILLRRPGRQPTLAVAFRSRAGWQAVEPEPAGRALGHGYALTAHKSQGSEFDEVVLLLPDFACPIFTRELLYTAVSRARRSVVLCGSPEMLNLAVTTKETRDSGVAARLGTLVTPLT